MSATQRLNARAQANLSVGELHRQAWRGTSGVYLVMLTLAVAMTPFMVYLDGRYGLGLALGGLLAVILIVLTVRRPLLGFYTLAFAAVVIEQDALTTPIFTDRLFIFSWPAHFAGLPERPIGFYILALVLIICVFRLATRKGLPLRGGALLWPFLAFMACVVMGIAHGLATGGNFRIIVLEIRPFWYLFATYLVAYNLVTEKRHVMTFFWILVLGTIFKALQGCYLVIVQLHGHISGAANEIMAHEQSYFFVLVMLLVLLGFLTGRMRAMTWFGVAAMPFIVIALLANNRRADYFAFMLGAIAVWMLAIVSDEKRRKQLIASFMICGAIGAMYILVFGSVQTPISAPAMSIISVIQPSKADARDLASNLYRDFENADLKYTEQQSPILGYGFGKPFLEPDPLPNIVGLDPYYLYIPHNNILWIWMRLGPLGYLAFWYLFGAAIVTAGVIMKRLRDPDLRMVAMYAVGAFVMEIPLAYGDYQIYFYRNIFFTGLLMGLLLRLSTVDEKIVADQAEAEAKAERRSRRSPMAGPRSRQVASTRDEATADRLRQRAPVGGETSLASTRAAAANLRRQYQSQFWAP